MAYIQVVVGELMECGVNLTTLLHIEPKVKKQWSYTSTPPYICKAWRLLDTHSFTSYQSLQTSSTYIWNSLRVHTVRMNGLKSKYVLNTVELCYNVLKATEYFVSL
jgi:hypothetical protein